MVLTLKNKTNEAKKQLNAALTNKETTPEQVSAALEAYVTAAAEDVGK